MFNNGGITSLGVAPNGNVYAANGQQSSSQYYIAKYDGTSWSRIFTASPIASNVHVDAKGTVYADNFYAFNMTTGSVTYNISKLTGTTWTQAGALDGNSVIIAMTSDKKGNLFAAGAFRDTNNNTYVAEYTSATTTAVVAGNYLDNNIKIYPNPTQNIVSIDIDATLIGTSYSVYDYTTAHSIVSGTLSDLHTSIDVEHLKAGIYLVQLGDNAKNAFKIMKK